MIEIAHKLRTCLLQTIYVHLSILLAYKQPSTTKNYQNDHFQETHLMPSHIQFAKVEKRTSQA